MRKWLKLATLLIPLLGLSMPALAVCSGASGLPFNCTNAVSNPQPNDIIFGGVTTGAQNGQSVKWLWSQVLASIPIPAPGSYLSSSLTSANIYLGNAGNIATATALSGDCMISSTGVLTCTKINGTGVTLGGAVSTGGALTTGGAFTTSGAFGLTFTITGTTNITLPTSGTMLTVMQNYLTGLTLSNDGTTPTTKLDTAAGTAADSTNAQMITIGAFVKSISGAWTAGSGNNGMGNGLTVAASTWYHVCLAYNGGTPDEWFDTSVTCANKPSGVSGALFRRIGSFKTNGSSQIVAFTQFSNQFLWAVEAPDVSTAALTTSSSLFALSVPLGVKTFALWRATISNAAAAVNVLITSPDETAQSAGAGAANGATQVGTQGIAFAGQTLVNTSQQIRAISSAASTSLVLSTYGWIDTRGQ